MAALAETLEPDVKEQLRTTPSSLRCVERNDSPTASTQSTLDSRARTTFPQSRREAKVYGDPFTSRMQRSCKRNWVLIILTFLVRRLMRLVVLPLITSSIYHNGLWISTLSTWD